ncbi:MAG: cache domain-containing protein [Pseudomonadota bacterium]|nr:cache domain-containing protein [Pseudomonadota bacterium]
MISRFTAILVMVIIFSFVLLGGALTFFEYERFVRQLDEFKEEVTLEQRQTVRMEVERTIEYLESRRRQVEDVARKRLMGRVYRAQKIFDNLKTVYGEALDDSALQQMFFTVLRSQRFIDKGYYFISDFTGISRLNPNRPEFEGVSIAGKTDSRGLDLVAAFTRIAKEEGEGFQRYYFRKPGEPKEKDFPKIAFIKRLEPYKMYIGTGIYLDDLEAEIRNDIGAYIKAYRFGYNNSGYIFIIKINDLNGGERFGTMFANANRPDLVGKPLSDSVTDARGKFFRREFLKGLREKGECYVEYWYKRFEHPEPEPKLTFFKHYTAAGLIVAAGSYLPENEKLVAQRRGELISKLQRDLLPILITLAIISLIMLLLARWWTRKSGREFDRFRNFFSRTAIRGEKLKEEEFSFPEMQVMARDANLMLTERDKLDEKLKESEELFRTLTETSPAGIVIHQGEALIYANSAVSVISGYSNEELIGMPFWQLVHPDMQDVVKERGQDRCSGVPDVPSSYQFKIINKDKKERWLIFSAAQIIYQGKPASFGNIVDVTQKIVAEEALAAEQLKSEKELERMRKMEAVGLLAGGIAHDFNNLLTAIYGNISLALIQLKRTEPDLAKAGKNLEAAERSSTRARDLTRQLLTFAKGGAPVKELVDIELMIKETAEFSLSGSNVRLEFDFSPELKSLEVDKGQFCQVINNLVLNADQAMPDGGSLTIRAENVVADDIGDVVRITLTDEGVGIPAQYLDRVFDPYFTTKQEGSGLGLATIHSIITRHGGQLTVTSEPGQGSCFTILLPASGREVEKGMEKMEMVSGSGRILVMDDEEVIREVCVEFLTDLGYEVESVADGQAMLGHYKAALQQGTTYDLVIMDLTIPGGMGGKEAMAALLEIDPRARGIVCSGYSNDPIMADFKAYGFQGSCAKPFQFTVLTQVVKEVLS